MIENGTSRARAAVHRPAVVVGTAGDHARADYPHSDHARADHPHHHAAPVAHAERAAPDFSLLQQSALVRVGLAAVLILPLWLLVLWAF
jgi:hypothetical protein